MAAFACLLLIGGAPDDAAMAKELAPLYGTWSVSSIEIRGNKATENIPIEKLIFAKELPKTVEKGCLPLSFTVDASQSPKRISIAEKSGKKPVQKGIYRLDGDILKLCMSEKGEPPTEFATAADNDFVLLELKRLKP